MLEKSCICLNGPINSVDMNLLPKAIYRFNVTLAKISDILHRPEKKS